MGKTKIRNSLKIKNICKAIDSVIDSDETVKVCESRKYDRIEHKR